MILENDHALLFSLKSDTNDSSFKKLITVILQIELPFSGPNFIRKNFNFKMSKNDQMSKSAQSSHTLHLIQDRD